MADSVTISLLPVSLALVHLPRSRLDTLTKPVLRQIISPSHTFLNVTCNEIELSLFVEHHALKDFEEIARTDARKLRARHKSDRTDTQGEQQRKKRRRHVNDNWEPVEVSADKWSVLQIDSHSDQLDNSGARVRELSAPLAAAGISILYQSSYMSDFIFVKSARLHQVMSLLASAGFDLYSSDPTNFTSQLSTFTSPLLSPIPADNHSISALDLNSVGSLNNQCLDPEGGAVFTRSRSSTDATSSSSGSRKASIPPLFQMSNPLDFSASVDLISDSSEDIKMPAHPPKAAMGRSQSHSPSGCDVTLLVPDLTYVGLADDSAELWQLKIVKLVAFPELIVGGGSRSVDSISSSSSSVVMFSRASSPTPGDREETTATELPMCPVLVEPLVEVSLCIVTAGSDGEAGDTSGSDTTTRVGLDSPKEDRDIVLYESSETAVLSIHTPKALDDEAEDETVPLSDEEPEPESTASDVLTLDEESQRQRSLSGSSAGTPQFAHHDGIETAATVETVLPSHLSSDANISACQGTGMRSRSGSTSSSASSSSADVSPPLLVPFFSFTHTSEGSSLTAPVSLLAALFPPHERHMVICSDELDVVDLRRESPAADGGDTGDGEGDGDGDGEPQGPLRCLQIDLRKFGLDKHGLVNRFSRTLEENGINHMYNSTFKTANLLVDKAHATRAQALLRSC